MTPKASTRLLIGIALIVLLAGGGGVYAMTLIGSAIPSPPPPPAVVILAAPGQRIITNTPLPTLEPSAFVYLSLDWTLEPTDTLTPTDSPTPADTPTGTITPSATVTPSSTPTPTDTHTPTPTFTPTLIPRPNGLAPSAYLPTISARAREIYYYGVSHGNSPYAFTRLGDCHSAWPDFLGAFDNPASYRLGQYAYLQEVINVFAGSFGRNSKSARSGFHMGSYFSPLWADPGVCQGNENPMECEYRLFRPSIVLVNIGTLNEASPDTQYEEFVRPIIEFWVTRGVLPVLNTKADNIEGGWRFNAAIRRLAQEYDIPLWDFWVVSQTLPNQGLADDNIHLSDGKPFFDDPIQMQTGWTLRNLTGLEALYVVWKGLQ